MKPMLRMPSSKWVTALLFVALFFSSFLHPNLVTAQSNDPSSASWTLEFNVPISAEQLAALGGLDGARAQLEQMLATKALERFNAHGEIQPVSGDTFAVVIQGNSSLDVLRELIFAELSPELDFLNGPVEVNATFPVQQGQQFALALETRPATGYLWEIPAGQSSLLAQVGEPQVQSTVEAASAPARETLQLQATGDGEARLHAVYRRSWEADQPVARKLTVALNALPDSVELTNPVEPVQTEPPVLEAAGVGEPSVGLPASWDWRAQGKVPAVRNQGGCGSCWAFGTVGAMEAAMMVQAGYPATDLSEQYLVSCNSSGYSCNGGWWAHDYHTDRLGKSQSAPGAVLESDKPYSASNGSCTASLTHSYKLASWGYVSGGYNAVPSVESIKNAIYNYGPVSAAVCSGKAWGGYKGGVFATEERTQCGGTGQVNHAILLVGWNDADQTWILRNSWGASWGESGYMRIRWGTSQVGYGATYVQINAPTPATNDAIGSATAIDHPGGALEYRDSANTLAATTEANDPLFALKPATQGNSTVWYKFSPVSTGTLAIDTYNSSYDTLLGVYSGEPGALKLVKWNDNTSTRKQSYLSLTTGKGLTYYIEVAAKSGAGQLAFHLKYTPATLSNNSISYATTVKSAGVSAQTNYSIVADVARASVSTSDPLFPNYGRGFRTVWYKFVAPAAGTLSVTTNGTNYANLLGVWQKVSTKYTLLGWSDAGNVENVTLVKGKTYYIEIASQAGAGPSALRFGLSFTPAE